MDTEDPVEIAAFHHTGYQEASTRDTAAQTQIEQALVARTKAAADLTELRGDTIASARPHELTGGDRTAHCVATVPCRILESIS